MAIRRAIALAALLAAAGCATIHKDTTGFAKRDSLIVGEGLEPTWFAVKTVLREHKYDIYTRDTNGAFVAYSPERRRWLNPNRTQFTIEIEEIAENQSRVTIATLDQEYGVTLLTYPAWHNQPTGENTRALQLLEAIHDKVGPPE